MDIAWKLGTGSKVCDWELRMSMRSFRENYQDDGNYWIIGHIPEWIDRQKIRCLPWPDPYRHCKDANLLHKALRLAMEKDLSSSFIFCSDDQLLLRPTKPSEFVLWNCGEIPELADAGMNKWQKRLVNTGLKLRSAGYGAMNFEGHIPYPLAKDWISEALRFDFATRPGMCVHSTILNCSGVASESLLGKNVRAWLGDEQLSESTILKKLSTCLFGSLNNNSVSNQTLISQIELMFSAPAPWELDVKDSSHKRKTITPEAQN